MEPLVAESVVLSPSGEPVHPERKSSPTSPRPLSDDEGTSFISIILLFSCFFFSLWIDSGGGGQFYSYTRFLYYYYYYLFFRHFLLVVLIFSSSFQFNSLLFLFPLIIIFLYMFLLFFRVGFSGKHTNTFR